MASVFRNARIQRPLGKFRTKASSVWRIAFAKLGQYQPFLPEETQTQAGDPVPFSGDIPIDAGSKHLQRRRFFSAPRPFFEEVENFTVTPAGHGWKDDVLYERYSATTPGLRALRPIPKADSTIPYGYFIQAEHIDTFGDWMSEYLSPISGIPNIDGPILLPKTLSSRSYVLRDCKRLNLDFQFIDRTTKIARAKIIRQQRVIRYWSKTEADNLRHLLNIEPVSPNPGSIIYLSRKGESSEVAERKHPHESLERLVMQWGGKVLRTCETTLDAYREAATEAETVILDHGSAGYNMAYWSPKRVVEITSDSWWMSSFLFFADSIGVRDYAIVRSDLGRPARAAEKLDEILNRPIKKTIPNKAGFPTSDLTERFGPD